MVGVQAAATHGRSYRGLSPAERTAERRQRLIESAIELYGSHGYTAVPIGEICRAARVKTRHFYELFSGSEELLLATYDAIIAEQTARIVGALEQAPDTLEGRVRAGVSAAAQIFADDQRARIIQQEVLGTSPAVERRRQEVLQAFAELIADQAERFSAGERSREELVLRGHVLGGGLNEALLAWRMQPRRTRPPLDDLVDSLIGVFLAVLGR